MGSVFEAINIKLRKRVAIKVLRPELASRETAVRRFLREARSASAIEHRNIVSIHDYGELDGGNVYYVMEFLQGQDLAKVLSDRGRLPWARARGILLQTVRAIKAAHDAGFIHRDIKPANIFLVEPREDEPPDRVKVLDFGIAKAEGGPGNSALTGLGDLMGTAWYMSPEQAQGQSADKRTDIYAAGILMYQVLTGRVPFDDTDSFRVLLRHVKEAPRPLRELAPDVPPQVHDVVMRCLLKVPALRIQSMRALEHALSSIGPRGEPVQPSTMPPPQELSEEPAQPPLVRAPAHELPDPETMPLPNGGLPMAQRVRAALGTPAIEPMRTPKTEFLERSPLTEASLGAPPGPIPSPETTPPQTTPPTQLLSGMGVQLQGEPTESEETTGIFSAPPRRSRRPVRPQSQDLDEAPTSLSHKPARKRPAVPIRTSREVPRSVIEPRSRPAVALSPDDATRRPRVVVEPDALPLTRTVVPTDGPRQSSRPRPAVAPGVVPRGELVSQGNVAVLASGPQVIPPPHALTPTDPRAVTRASTHRWWIVAALAGAVAIALGGWVALLLTEKMQAEVVEPGER